MYPTAEDRKANPYPQCRKRLGTITLDEDETNPRYELEGAEPYDELQIVSHPEPPDTKQPFKQTIFEEV